MAQIEGRNPVVEALKGRRKVKKLLLQQGVQGKRIEYILQEAKKRNIPLERVSKRRLEDLANSSVHQGVIAYGEDIDLLAPIEIVRRAKEKGESPLIVVLDQIQDPYNFGSIIRTAYAAGAHGLVFQKRRAAGITPVVLKASAGAAEHLPLSEVSNINYAIDELKEEGVWFAGADIGGEQYHYQADLKGPLGIVIGSEGQGLRRLVKEKCDFLVKIPLKGKIDSLNASVAAGIIIYEALRQRL